MLRLIKCTFKFFVVFSLICSCSGRDLLEENFFSLSRYEIKVASDETEEYILVSSNIEWYVDNNIPDWISVRTVVSEESGCIYLLVQENCDIGVREGYITLFYGDDNVVIKIIQEDKKVLYFESNEVKKVSFDADQISLSVVCNTAYSVKTDVGWIKIQGTADASFSQQYYFSSILSLNIEKNVDSSERTGNIIIYNETYDISDTLSVLQQGAEIQLDTNVDGAWNLLQEAIRGNVNIVIMGDGFVKESLMPGGEYEKAMRLAMEYFFSLEPYKTFRDYFNVYQVYVESEEAGVGDKRGKFVNNRLGSKYGDGTEIDCNLSLCLSYVEKIDCLPDDKPVTVIVVLNDTKYAGTTYMYASGDAIALCPMSNLEAPNDFEGLIHHEAGGHGFGFLTDEYVYYQETIPSNDVNNMQQWQSLGLMMNLCFSNVTEESHWYDIISTGLYPEAGLYEGGGLYQYGVWRSESNSCMNNNVPYYNVQSRRIIINRIMQLSNVPYTFEKFLEDDYNIIRSADIYSNNCVSLQLQVAPLAPPVYVNDSFRNKGIGQKP